MSSQPLDRQSLQNTLFTPPGGPPRVEAPSHAIYAHMGQDNIFQMLEDFYLELEQSAIRFMFPEDMVAASKRSAAFFVGLLGGPPLYQQLYGPPMMRARHLPFPIDEEGRQVWVDCFFRVLDNAPQKYNFPEEHLPGFRAWLDGFSGWMVNTPSE